MARVYGVKKQQGHFFIEPHSRQTYGANDTLILDKTIHAHPKLPLLYHVITILQIHKLKSACNL